MKISLQLKLGQQLTMTPQLQQAIRLLQLSTLDLQQEIHQALESNPMLEIDESWDGSGSESGDESGAEGGYENDGGEYTEAATTLTQETDQLAYESAQELYRELPSTDNSYESADDGSGWDESIPEQLPVDTSWDDIYQNSYSAGSPRLTVTVTLSRVTRSPNHFRTICCGNST